MRKALLALSLLTTLLHAGPRPKVRAITAFIDIDARNYAAQFDSTMRFVNSAREAYRKAGFEVETVRIAQIIQITLARPRFCFGNSVVKQFHQVRAIRIVTVGRSQKSGGFVERKQMFVFKQNRNFPKFVRGG